jgi:hypothetical protein
LEKGENIERGAWLHMDRAKMSDLKVGMEGTLSLASTVKYRKD